MDNLSFPGNLFCNAELAEKNDMVLYNMRHLDHMITMYKITGNTYKYAFMTMRVFFLFYPLRFEKKGTAKIDDIASSIDFGPTRFINSARFARYTLASF